MERFNYIKCGQTQQLKGADFGGGGAYGYNSLPPHLFFGLDCTAGAYWHFLKTPKHVNPHASSPSPTLPASIKFLTVLGAEKHQSCFCPPHVGCVGTGFYWQWARVIPFPMCAPRGGGKKGRTSLLSCFCCSHRQISPDAVRPHSLGWGRTTLVFPLTPGTVGKLTVADGRGDFPLPEGLGKVRPCRCEQRRLREGVVAILTMRLLLLHSPLGTPGFAPGRWYYLSWTRNMWDYHYAHPSTPPAHFLLIFLIHYSIMSICGSWEFDLWKSISLMK